MEHTMAGVFDVPETSYDGQPTRKDPRTQTSFHT